jgi:hypothetical protein
MSDQDKDQVKAKTYTVLPESEKLGPATITCNSVESCASTAKIFFWTPCKIVMPGEETPSYSVSKDGSVKKI